jgi:hypothetical protein
VKALGAHREGVEGSGMEVLEDLSRGKGGMTAGQHTRIDSKERAARSYLGDELARECLRPVHPRESRVLLPLLPLIRILRVVLADLDLATLRDCERRV